MPEPNSLKDAPSEPQPRVYGMNNWIAAQLRNRNKMVATQKEIRHLSDSEEPSVQVPDDWSCPEDSRVFALLSDMLRLVKTNAGLLRPEQKSALIS